MSGTPRRLSGRRLTAAIGFLTVLVIGCVGLAVAGGSNRRDTAFSVDVPAAVTIPLAPGQTACQGPISVAEPSSGLAVWVPPQLMPGATLEFTVRLAGTGAAVAQGPLHPGSVTPAPARLEMIGAFIRTIAPGWRIDVCLRASGNRGVALQGGFRVSGSGRLTIDQQLNNLDLALVFVAPHPASVLSLAPTIFGRAALFHPTWMGAWIFWVLAAGLLAGAFLALISLLSTISDDEPASDPDQRRESPAPPPA